MFNQFACFFVDLLIVDKITKKIKKPKIFYIF